MLDNSPESLPISIFEQKLKENSLSNKKISIVIPCYNEEKTIIESVKIDLKK